MSPRLERGGDSLGFAPGNVDGRCEARRPLGGASERLYLSWFMTDDVAMSVDADRARALALDLPGVSEAPHFHRSAFRTTKRIFATLDAAAGDLNLMFDPDHRDFYCESDTKAFSAVPGGWGRRGATRCLLSAVSEPSLKSALAAAHQLAAPTPKAPKVSRTPKARRA